MGSGEPGLRRKNLFHKETKMKTATTIQIRLGWRHGSAATRDVKTVKTVAAPKVVMNKNIACHTMEYQANGKYR